MAHRNAAPLKSSAIFLSHVFGRLVVRGEGIEVEFKDGRVIVHSGSVELPGHKQVLESSTSPAAPKLGEAVAEGPNKGWIYCETEQSEAFLVAPEDSGVATWEEARNIAERVKAGLASREQLAAMYKARDTGALKGTFNAGWYWSAANRDRWYSGWCQNFDGGHRAYLKKDLKFAVRCVRRHSII